MVDLLPPPCWTMSVALSRKRSRLTVDSDDDEAQSRREPSPVHSVLSDTLKRSRTQCELDELDIVGVDEAWRVDVDAILASNRIATRPYGSLEAHDNWARYSKGESIMVLCVQGNVHTHYDLLWSVLLKPFQSRCSHSQFRSTRSLHAFAVPASLRPLPRSSYTQSLLDGAFYASHDTSGRSAKQSLRSARPTAPIGRREVSTGCLSSARSSGETETGPAVWLGRWQTCRDTSWWKYTNSNDGSAEKMC
jgi:hypothetical protein